MRNQSLYKTVLIAMFFISINTVTAQGFYILGGGTYAWINNYNDDKGSEYFNESNYKGWRGLYHYTFGIGLSIHKPMNNHVFELTYKQIGGIGTYKSWERPQFGEVFPGLIVGDPDYQEQGFIATTIGLKYYYQKEIINRLLLSVGIGDDYLVDYKIYNYLSSGNPPNREMRALNSYIRDQKYLNRHNLVIGVCFDFILTKLTSISLEYSKFIFGINRKVDEIMIRKYHPNLLSLTIKIRYGEI